MNFALLVFVLLILSSLLWDGITAITDGSAPSSDYPWMVFMRAFADDEAVDCTGTLVSPDTVLTSAYCLSLFRQETGSYPQRVFVGAEAGSSGTELSVRCVTIHPDYTEPVYEPIVDCEDDEDDGEDVVDIEGDEGFCGEDEPVPIIQIGDLATLKLEGALTGVDTVAFATSSSSPSSLVGAGYGVNDLSSDNSGVLRQYSASLVDTSTCASSYQERFQETLVDTAKTYCVQPTDAAKPCDFDWGGPLLNEDNVQVGILMGELAYCEEEDDGLGSMPFVYTDVSRYADWIQGRIDDYYCGCDGQTVTQTVGQAWSWMKNQATGVAQFVNGQLEMP